MELLQTNVSVGVGVGVKEISSITVLQTMSVSEDNYCILFGEEKWTVSFLLVKKSDKKVAVKESLRGPASLSEIKLVIDYQRGNIPHVPAAGGKGNFGTVEIWRYNGFSSFEINVKWNSKAN